MYRIIHIQLRIDQLFILDKFSNLLYKIYRLIPINVGMRCSKSYNFLINIKLCNKSYRVLLFFRYGKQLHF